jgi:hypothetical protein
MFIMMSYIRKCVRVDQGCIYLSVLEGGGGGILFMRGRIICEGVCLGGVDFLALCVDYSAI